MEPMLSRRSLVRSAAIVSAAALLAHYPGARLIRAQNSETYDLVDFGPFETIVTRTLPSVQSNIAGRVYAINELGHSTGKIGVSEERFSPAVWAASGRLRRLQSGQLGGKGVDINSADEVAGALFGETTDAWRPVIWRDGEPIVLPLVEGASGGEARGLNDEGVAVGVNQPGNVPVRWTEEAVARLPVPPETLSAVATGVNNAGTIAGTILQEDRITRRAVLWHGDDVGVIDVPEEIDDGGLVAFSAINLLDQVVVIIYDYSVAPIWDYYYVTNGTAVSRVVNRRSEGLSLRPRDINDAGEVVGHAYDEDRRFAFVERDGEIIDLNTLAPRESGLSLYDAVGITNEGLIGGNAEGPDGFRHGFLLVPSV